MTLFDQTMVSNAEVTRTNRVDRPYEVLSRPCIGRIIDTPGKLLAFQALFLATTKQAPFDVSDVLVARIDAGRWLDDCVCGDAPVIDPEWSLACCFTCGRIYRHIQMPQNAAAIEATLLQRPMQHRFWFPRETVQMLQAENVAHGVAVPEVF